MTKTFKREPRFECNHPRTPENTWIAKNGAKQPVVRRRLACYRQRLRLYMRDYRAARRQDIETAVTRDA